MKEGAHIALASAARFYTPLMALFACVLLALRAGGGVGFVAGLAFLLALLTHVLVFGAAAARAATPPLVTRLLTALGMVALVLGATVPRAPFAGQLIEGGVFAVTAAGGALMLAVLIGRAPTLREEEL